MSELPLYLNAIPIAGILVLSGFYAGIVPIPVGYERGKIKWFTWCAVGMHPHICYWHSAADGHTDYAGLQTIHPDDISDGDSA